jgi:transposase
LFNEAEELAEQAVGDDEEEKIAYTRQKPKREKISADIPRERVIYDISDENKICDCCQHTLHPIGEVTSEKLEFSPAQVKVNVCPKYACNACEKNGTSNTIKQAPVPASIIPKGYATPSLLSLPTVSKLLPVNTSSDYRFTSKMFWSTPTGHFPKGVFKFNWRLIQIG